MKNRALLLTLVISTMIFSGCEDDLPPEKNVGNITFVITEENTPQTLSGVSIQLFSDDDPSVTPTDRTDASGRCTFSNIPIGSYHLNLSKPGYESKEGLTLRVNGGDNPYKEISLKRATTTLTVAPDVLDFGDNESVVQKAFSLVNPNYEDLTWAVLDTDVPWIVSVCDKDGKKSGTIKYNQEVAMSVTIDRNALTSGNNESTIVILSDYGRAELMVKAVGADRRTPITEINDVQDIKINSAVFSASIEFPGSPTYTERGFVYSTSSIKNMDDPNCIFRTVPTNDDLEFSLYVSDLTKGTKYYVRSYAKNDIGVSLSAHETSFVTCDELTQVSTLEVQTLYVQNGRAILQGEIITKGDPIYTEKGFCYNQVGEPDINDATGNISGNDIGKYEYVLSPVEINTTYYIRAYAIQNNRIEYGDIVILDTHPRDVQVSTLSISDFTDYGTVKLNGMIVDVGFPNYYEKGFCLATNNNPTINDIKETIIDENYSTGRYSIEFYVGTETYYYRAYAKQGNEVRYGDVIKITKENRTAQVRTETKKDLSAGLSVLYGTVSDVGYPIISERGIEYGKTEIADNSWQRKRDMYRTDGEFAIEVLLDGGVQYYYRAYVIQDGAVIHGATYNFMSYQTPLIYTEPVYSSDIESYKKDYLMLYKVELSGIEFKAAYPECKEYGFIYSRYSDVAFGKTGSIKTPAQTIGQEDGYKVFRCTLDGLYENDTYYFRAYAVSDGQYYYGEVESFSL